MAERIVGEAIVRAVTEADGFGILLTQPLCGGMPPHLAWPSLELMASDVLPHI